MNPDYVDNSIHIDIDIDRDITLYFAKCSGNRTRFPGVFGFLWIVLSTATATS